MFNRACNILGKETICFMKYFRNIACKLISLDIQTIKLQNSTKNAKDKEYVTWLIAKIF